MVPCVVIGCSKRSGCDKRISFYRIPAIIKGRIKQEFELSKKRTNVFLSAISREDLSLTQNATTFEYNIFFLVQEGLKSTSLIGQYSILDKNDGVAH